ncbi:unnamed protein product [Eruca vesicaria subsp. sativa]|uniref:Uncharacterized protein n=1 Tax=Eruca vesicaria subsp. sativa TaxID=29727 RepID=A0ABC8M297_ERUVS|nr:unnamed protein product [Eruca vesicaria subsp. sativa]
MKMKKKGKVYPSPPPPTQQPSSSSSSSHYLNEDHSLSILKLLPATILVLVSVLSAEDREVLAYLITRGTTTISTDSNNKKTKTATKKKNKSSRNHKPPVFDCECFDCYTNYWLRWDSSPNRELIHDIIEAFENHHLTEDSTSRNKSKRGKKKEKEKVVPPVIENIVSERHVSSPENSPGRVSEAEVEEQETRDDDVEEEVIEEAKVVFQASGHKGLARKVLPDVLGLFSSSFWRLWNPNA